MTKTQPEKKITHQLTSFIQLQKKNYIKIAANQIQQYVKSIMQGTSGQDGGKETWLTSSHNHIKITTKM